MLHTTIAIRLGHAIRVRLTEDRGQSTTEYALLLLGVASIALAVTAWASGTGKISDLFDSVIDSIIGRV